MNHTPEHKFQAWTCRFLDRVLLPPQFYSSIDVAASDMKNMGRRASLQARGCVFGFPDMAIMQGGGAPVTCFLELKRGRNKATEQQVVVHSAMQKAGQHVYVVRTMQEVLQALRDCGFRLHENADNLAVEYEMRAEVTPRKTAAPRKRVAKALPSVIARAHAAGVWKP